MSARDLLRRQRRAVPHPAEDFTADEWSQSSLCDAGPTRRAGAYGRWIQSRAASVHD